MKLATLTASCLLLLVHTIEAHIEAKLLPNLPYRLDFMSHSIKPATFSGTKKIIFKEEFKRSNVDQSDDQIDEAPIAWPMTDEVEETSVHPKIDRLKKRAMKLVKDHAQKSKYMFEGRFAGEMEEFGSGIEETQTSTASEDSVTTSEAQTLTDAEENVIEREIADNKGKGETEIAEKPVTGSKITKSDEPSETTMPKVIRHIHSGETQKVSSNEAVETVLTEESKGVTEHVESANNVEVADTTMASKVETTEKVTTREPADTLATEETVTIEASTDAPVEQLDDDTKKVDEQLKRAIEAKRQMSMVDKVRPHDFVTPYIGGGYMKKEPAVLEDKISLIRRQIQEEMRQLREMERIQIALAYGKNAAQTEA